jgi:hypothetical protein
MRHVKSGSCEPLASRTEIEKWNDQMAPDERPGWTKRGLIRTLWTPMSYRAVIFDLFGTLAERFPVPAYRQTLGRMAKTLAVPPDRFLREWNAGYVERGWSMRRQRMARWGITRAKAL